MSKSKMIIQSKVSYARESLDFLSELQSETKHLGKTPSDIIKKQRVYEEMCDNLEELPNIGSYIRNVFEIREELIREISYLINFGKGEELLIEEIADLVKEIETCLENVIGISIDEIGDMFDTDSDISTASVGIKPSQHNYNKQYTSKADSLKYYAAHKMRMLTDEEYCSNHRRKVAKNVKEVKNRYKSALVKLEAKYAISPSNELAEQIEVAKKLHFAQMNKYNNKNYKPRAVENKELKTIKRMFNVLFNDNVRPITQEITNIINLMTSVCAGVSDIIIENDIVSFQLAQNEVKQVIDLGNIRARNSQIASIIEKAFYCKKEELAVLSQKSELSINYIVEKRNEFDSYITQLTSVRDNMKNDIESLILFTKPELRGKLDSFVKFYNGERKVIGSLIAYLEGDYVEKETLSLLSNNIRHKGIIDCVKSIISKGV